MINNKLSISTRIIVALCSISLIAVLFIPIWRIDLNAPQYPEGLSLSIYAKGLRGDVAIINGLNHYIGMKTLHNEDFFEFTILPYCILFFAVVFLLAAIINRKGLFYTTFLLFVLFGIIAMVDFWRWEYNYGHNLDPHAAIVIPGMAYQPPLIGYKQLLNFAAYSIPAIGGWIFICCGALLLMGVIVENKVFAKFKKRQLTPAFALLFIFFLSSCNSKPEPINIGKDNCAYCKMTISDPKFGAEIILHTGMIYKFDDIHCLDQFLTTLPNNKKSEVAIYLSDFCNAHELIIESNCHLLKSADLRCPMNGHIAAFKSEDSLHYVMQTFKGEEINYVLQ